MQRAVAAPARATAPPTAAIPKDAIQSDFDGDGTLKYVWPVPPFSTHRNQWEADVVPIVPDSAHASHVLVYYSEFANESISTKTKSVPLR